jgi:ComF family protein
MGTPKIFSELFDFFLPRFCTSCKIKLNENEKIVCADCLAIIKIADKGRLHYEFERKFEDKKIISGFTSLYVFEKDKELQSIMHSLKYNQRFLAGKFLGEKIAEHLKNIINSWRVDFICPIPLHVLKKAERGYNQSFYISKGISKVLGIPVSNRIVKRKRFTESQTKMNMKEREENISGAFVLKSKKFAADKNILLVDDVITTGATVNECGKVLLRGGAKKIYAISAAIAD